MRTQPGTEATSPAFALPLPASLVIDLEAQGLRHRVLDSPGSEVNTEMAGVDCGRGLEDRNGRCRGQEPVAP